LSGGVTCIDAALKILQHALRTVFMLPLHSQPLSVDRLGHQVVEGHKQRCDGSLHRTRVIQVSNAGNARRKGAAEREPSSYIAQFVLRDVGWVRRVARTSSVSRIQTIFQLFPVRVPFSALPTVSVESQIVGALKRRGQKMRI
jgi:hypothetical protein